jgi:hypothetical protein
MFGNLQFLLDSSGRDSESGIPVRVAEEGSVGI